MVDMPSTDDIYGGNFLSVCDVIQAKTYTIAEIEVKKIREDDSAKIILRFQETDKSFPLNKTNAKRIAEKHGTDYTLWTGKKITLVKSETTYNGQEVDCIRVKRSEE